MFINESKILKTILFNRGISCVIALDEVGRGAGAGPVVVSATMWKVNTVRQKNPKWLPIIQDSKLLTPEKRELCFAMICADPFYTHLHDRPNYTLKEFLPVQTEIKPTFFSPKYVIKLNQKKMDCIQSSENLSFSLISFGFGLASNQEIDEWNICTATQVAGNRALSHICSHIKNDQEKNTLFQKAVLFIDGHLPMKLFQSFAFFPQVTIIKGDELLKTIGTSSVLGKVWRDNLMSNFKVEFPQYGFERHKGYLTQQHIEIMKHYGKTRLHRDSFLKNLNVS